MPKPSLAVSQYVPARLLALSWALVVSYSRTPRRDVFPTTNNFPLMVGTIDVITLNCQGLRSSASRETLFSWLNCSKIDFVCLQETHSVSDREFSRWLQQAKDDGLLSLDYQSISSPGSNRSCGVVILFQPRFTMVSSVTDPTSRFVSAQFVVDDHHFTICNVYGPNTSKDGAPFFEFLYAVIDPLVPCILCGDFNTVADPSRDR